MVVDEPMTPQEAKQEWARRCEKALPSLEEESVEHFKVEMPMEILCGDMLEIVKTYEAKGWITTLTHGGNGWWFASPATHENAVREAHDQRATERNLERSQLQRRLAEIDEEKKRDLALFLERMEKIKRGEHPYF